MKGMASTVFIGTMRDFHSVFVDAGPRSHDGLKMAAEWLQKSVRSFRGRVA